MRLILTMLLIAATTSVMAAEKVVIQLSQTEGLLITSATPITTEKIPIQQIGGPGPVIPQPPSPANLEQATKAAHAAVASYGDKDRDCKTIAFTINFLSQAIRGEGSSDSARAMIRGAADAAVGANADKWASFWTAIDAATAGQTATQYGASLKIVAKAMCADMASAQGGELFYGVDSFGLEKGWLEELFKILLPILLQLLQQWLSPSM